MTARPVSVPAARPDPDLEPTLRQPRSPPPEPPPASDAATLARPVPGVARPVAPAVVARPVTPAPEPEAGRPPTIVARPVAPRPVVAEVPAAPTQSVARPEPVQAIRPLPQAARPAAPQTAEEATRAVPAMPAPEPAVVVSAPAAAVVSSPWQEKKPHTFLRGMALLAMILLFEAFAIPRLAEGMELNPPWELVKQQGGLTFHAAAFFGVLLLLAAIPLPYLVRAATLTGAAATLLVFSLQHVRYAADAFAFRGHPGIEAFLEPTPLALGLMALAFPTALYWRSRYTASLAARIAVMLGLVLAVVAFLSVGRSVGASEGLVQRLIAVVKSGLRGDRAASACLLLPLVAIPFSLLVWLRHPRSGAAGLWAFLFTAGLGSAPIALAAHVASYREGAFKYVFAPLKPSLLLLAALLLLPIAAGHTLGETERLIRAFRERRKARSSSAKR